MYSCIYQMKKDKYNSESGNSITNNYEFFKNYYYKENQIENKKINISL